MKKLIIPFIQQRDRTECGTTCLAMILRYYGLPNLQASLRDLADVSNSGVNLYTLSEVAREFGFNAEGYKVEYEHLPDCDLPCIAHYEGNHFIVVHRVTARRVAVADPAYGKTYLSRQDFEKNWNGVILNLEPTESLFKGDRVREILKNHRQKQGFIRGFYLGVLRPFRRVLAEVILASGVLQLMGVILPFFTQAILDKVIGQRHLELMFAILGGLCLVSVLQILLGYARSMLLAQFKIQFELKFFSKLFRHLIHLTQKYFDSHKKEDFINRFQENLKIRNLFSSAILQSFINLLFLFNFIIILFLYHPPLASLAMLFMGVIIIITVIYTPKLRKLESRIFHKNEKTMGAFLDALLGIQTVKLRVLESMKLASWENRYQNALLEELHAEKSYMILGSLMGGVNLLSQVTIYWLGAYYAFAGSLSIGQYIAFVSIYGLVMGSINAISGLWFMLMEASVTYEKLNDIFIQEPEQLEGVTEPAKINQPRVEFQAVCFKYNQSAPEYTLQNINLAVPAGTRVGIVGRNGSGKTTLVKLLTKMYPAYTGRILIGDQELHAWHPHTIRKQIHMLPQNVYLFNGTIKENILLARPGATDEEVIEAAWQADLHPFIHKLYLGYNHRVGESGDNLSSGQRLKIAFARLFLSKPEVIILDEASSVLDGEAEQRIFGNVFTYFRGKTFFLIAHRLRTLTEMDLIVVLEKGEIVEQGKHAALIARRGVYYTLMKNYLEF